MKRLSAIADIDGPAARPSYSPENHGRGIVHLGIGAFHRAHQAAMTDAALAHVGGDWRITGVSLRSTDAGEALTPQNGLYTLIENAPEGPKARVIGAIKDVISADPKATLAVLTDPAVKIVTLTVTEKGYGIDRNAHAPDWSHAAVAADRENPRAPCGVLGLLCEGLRLRKAAGIAPFTVLSCDNLPENGALLKAGVVGFAKAEDPDFADWIAREVAFPSSMVDRITPASTDDTLAEAERQIGCKDLAAVATEPFSQWVIEDHFPQGRPDWEAGGAQFVKDVLPYESMKLTMLNGSHSMIAYAGCLLGHRYVRDVMADQRLLPLVRRHLQAAAATVPAVEGMDLKAYAKALEDRFHNPAIAHETRQIAMDGTEKLPQRIFAPALLALSKGQDIKAFAFVTALWMRHALASFTKSLPLNDPRQDKVYTALETTPHHATKLVAAFSNIPNFIPEALSANPLWQSAVVERLERLMTADLAQAITAELQE